MQIAEVKLTGLSPYSPSRFLQSPRQDKEGHDVYEKRVWRERIHATTDGEVFIPPMAFKGALETAARFNPISIPGRGKATYTKHFRAGVLVVEPVLLGVQSDDVEGEWLLLNSDGRKGGGTRVMRCMPKVDDWSASVRFYILDPTITQEVFERTLREAGQFIGVGRWRPENGGIYGRFRVEEVVWSEDEMLEAA